MNVADAVLFGLLQTDRVGRPPWSVGTVFPRAWSEAVAGGEPWRLSTDLLLERPGPVALRLRFLQVAGDGATALREVALAARPPGPSESAFAFGPVRGRLAARWAGPVLTVRVENTGPSTGADRAAALVRALVSCQVLVSGGPFVSLQDPPSGWRDAAASCRARGWWPVLLGSDTVLVAPVLLPDHPEVPPPGPPPGATVRLRPRPGPDAARFAGRTATVVGEEHDLEGRRFVAVTLLDDPGADAGRHHRYFFAPDELDPVEADVR